MKDQKGFSLIEVVIAVALLGIIAAGFLGALATASKVLLIADVRATAESLVRSQMEYVKDQDYRASDYTPGPPSQGSDKSYLKIDAPDGYTIWSVNRSGATVEDIIGVPWDSQLKPPPEGQAVNIDAGRQRIKLVIYHLGKKLFELEDYKVDR